MVESNVMPHKPHKSEKKASRETMLARLLLPAAIAMMIQSFLFIILLWQGGVIQYVDENAYGMLTERASARARSINAQMLGNWANLSEGESAVMTSLRATMSDLNRDVSDMATDPALNLHLLDTVANDLVHLLRSNEVTGAFIVLNGPALPAHADPEHKFKASFYVRNPGAPNQSPGNIDLMAERGSPVTAKRLNLALGKNWAPAFSFSGASHADNESFFFAPMNAARATDIGGALSPRANYFGYWSNIFRLDPNDIDILTHSIPLIWDDGTVIGVLGIEVARTMLDAHLTYDEILPNRKGAYFLGISYDGGKTFERLSVSGPNYKRTGGNADTLMIGHEVAPDIYTLPNIDGGASQMLGCVQTFDLYKPNAPFAHEQWALIAVANEAELLSFSQHINQLAVMMILLGLALGLVGVYFCSLVVVRPITAVVTDLRQHDPFKPVTLRKLGIKEIDELTHSIEVLSASVAESSSKISTILSMTKSSIGVFEYDEGGNSVFCSDNLFEVLGWTDMTPLDNGANVQTISFFKRLNQFVRDNLFDEHEQIFQIDGGLRNTRWVQLTQLTQNGKVLGAVTDVTTQVLTKQQIEYERDYDTLTNLYNRRAFHHRLSELFTSGKSIDVAALIMWDLDDLKYINDTYGHECGDRYIATLADCLKFFVSEYGGIASRRSGDEFYTFLYGFPSQDALLDALGKGWENIMGTPFIMPNGVNYGVRVSGGFAWYKYDAVTWQDLLEYADYAMYAVKQNGKGSLHHFDKSSYQQNAGVLFGMEALNKLIDYALIKYAFQPIVSVKDGSVYGYELLMRPQVNEFRSPQDILRVARAQEKLENIERITWFKALEAFADRVNRGEIQPDQYAFIHSLGAQSLTDADIARLNNLYAPYLEHVVVELIENDQEASCSIKKAAVVHDWNAQLSFDNYGTGYICDAALSNLAPNFVKIDMSIVRNIHKDANRQNPLISMMSFVKSHNARIIACGVESRPELETLIALGVDYVQGNFIAEPSFLIEPIKRQAMEVLGGEG